MSVSGKKVQPVLDQSTFPDFVYLGHLFSLNREFKELLYGLKYRGLKRNGKFLAGFIRFHPDLVRIIGSYDALVPVPLHPLKKRERGYNQSQVIAESVSLRTGVPVGCGYLKRLRYTGTQTRLGRGRRLKNIASSIAAGPNKKFKKQKLLLVDDVLTTGATLTSCAKALKKVGVAEVGALTLAQALKTPDARDFRAELEMAGSFVF